MRDFKHETRKKKKKKKHLEGHGESTKKNISTDLKEMK